jgi:manganese transport protein
MASAVWQSPVTVHGRGVSLASSAPATSSQSAIWTRNWATDLGGGAAYGYTLLWIICLSSCMAMVLQILSARLGIVAQADLRSCAAATRPVAPPWHNGCCARLRSALAIWRKSSAPPLRSAVRHTAKLWRGIDRTRCAGHPVAATARLPLSGGVRDGIAGHRLLCFAVNLPAGAAGGHAVAAGFIPSAQTVTDPACCIWRSA